MNQRRPSLVLSSLMICAFLLFFSGSLKADITTFIGNEAVLEEQGEENLDFEELFLEDYEPYRLNTWQVIEELNSSQESFKLHDGKMQKVYAYKFWFINKRKANSNFALLFESEKENQRLMFSSDEVYVYYFLLDESSTDVLVGQNLKTQDVFVLGAGASARILSCPKQGEFILLKDSAEIDEFYLFDTNGSNPRKVSYEGPEDSFVETVCREIKPT